MMNSRGLSNGEFLRVGRCIRFNMVDGWLKGGLHVNLRRGLYNDPQEKVIKYPLYTITSVKNSTCMIRPTVFNHG